jgi:hypothetical protein
MEKGRFTWQQTSRLVDGTIRVSS